MAHMQTDRAERRAASDSSYEVVAVLPEIMTTYQDNHVRRGQVYLYRVKAVNRGGAAASDAIQVAVV
jgi:hypothetical protein